MTSDRTLPDLTPDSPLEDWLVYADWLEEGGENEAAAGLRWLVREGGSGRRIIQSSNGLEASPPTTSPSLPPRGPGVRFTHD